MERMKHDSHEIKREGKTWTLIYPDGDKYRGFRTQREAIGFVLSDNIKIRVNHQSGFHTC